MSRARRIALGLVAVLVALLAINTVIVNQDTDAAEVTIEGGEILELPSGDVQVLDEGPTARSAADSRREAAPIVLIHCDSCSLHWWDRLAPILAREHRVIRIDLLGHGGSEKPSGGYEISEQAATVAAALDRLEVQGAVVVGHSMGFTVATALAERASQLVDRLVNIGEGPSPDTCPLPFIAKLAYAPVLGQALWRVTPDFAIEDGYADAFAPGYETGAGFPNSGQIVDDHRAMTYSSFEQAHDGNDEYRDEIALHDRIRALAIPVLSIFGAEDEICDTEESQVAYRTLSGARTAEIKGAGHSPNVERPKETAAVIEEFAAGAAVPVAKPPNDGGRLGQKPAGSGGPAGGRPVTESRQREPGSGRRAQGGAPGNDERTGGGG